MMPSPAEPRSGNPVPTRDVAEMFDRIAPVYDRLNTVMTGGQDANWRRRAAAATRVGPGGSAIDLATGTGKLAAVLAETVGPFGRVVGLDVAPAMIDLARGQYPDRVQLEFIVGDALALPFEDGTFDAATIAFGLRNLPDFEGGFREMCRVVRPGGRVVCLELTLPRPRWWGRTFHALFRRLAPVAGRLAGHPGAYRYLPDSLDGFPDPVRLARAMRGAGLTDVTWKRYGLGSVALHVGRRPE